MKRYLHTILALLLSSFFLFAGTGFNVVHYCCDSCREAGIEHVAGESCEAIHRHEHHHHDGHCHHHNSCWMKHLQLNDYTQSAEQQVPAAQELLAFLPSEPLCLTDALLSFSHVSTISDTPPPPDRGADILRDICRWIC